MSTREIIKNYHHKVIERTQQSHPEIPLILLDFQDSTIAHIADLTVSECVELLILSTYALDLIEDWANSNRYSFLDDINNNNYRLWRGDEIVSKYLIHYKDSQYLIQSAQDYSLTGTWLGLISIRIMCIKRFYLYLIESGTRDQLYTYFSNEISEDNRNIPVINESYRNLCTFALNIYNKGKRSKDKEHEQVDDINAISSFIGEALQNAFPIDSFDAMVKAGEGDEKIKYIANRAASRFIRAQHKENKYSFPLLSIDSALRDTSEITFIDILTNSPSEILNVLENEDTIDEKTLTLTQLESILTLNQLKAYSMRMSMINGKQPTFQMIGDELGISKERAHYLFHQAKNKIKIHTQNQ